MPIRIACQHCGKNFSAWDDLIGKSVQCPKCQQSMIVQGATGGQTANSGSTRRGGAPADDATKRPSSQDPIRPAPTQPVAPKPVAPKPPRPKSADSAAPRPPAPSASAATPPVPRPPSAPSGQRSTVGSPDDAEDFDDRDDLPFGCPKCNAEMAPDDDLCNACGYHLILKKVIDMEGVQRPDTAKGFDRAIKKHLDDSESTDGMLLWAKMGGLFFVALVCFVCFGIWGLAFGAVLVVAYLIYRAQLRIRAEDNPDTHVERDPIAAILWTSMLTIQRLIGWRSPEPPFGALRVLTLRNATFTNEDLGQVEDLKQLQVLDIEGTGITDAGLRHLKGKKQLRFLVMKNTAVTPSGVERLQQSIPTTWIWY